MFTGKLPTPFVCSPAGERVIYNVTYNQTKKTLIPNPYTPTDGIFKFTTEINGYSAVFKWEINLYFKIGIEDAVVFAFPSFIQLILI